MDASVLAWCVIAMMFLILTIIQIKKTIRFRILDSQNRQQEQRSETPTPVYTIERGHSTRNNSQVIDYHNGSFEMCTINDKDGLPTYDEIILALENNRNYNSNDGNALENNNNNNNNNSNNNDNNDSINNNISNNNRH